METLVTSQSDFDKIDAFQIRIFRKTFNIKHSYWSHVTNDTVMRSANGRAQHIYKNIDMTPLSLKLKQRIKFYGPIIRSDPNTDHMRAITIDEDGNRISAPKPWRSGRPKLKWYKAAKPLVTHSFEQLNIPPNTWRTDFSQYEVNQYIIQAASDRKFQTTASDTSSQPMGFTTQPTGTTAKPSGSLSCPEILVANTG